MLTQILVTIAVAVAALLITRARNRPPEQQQGRPTSAPRVSGARRADERRRASRRAIAGYSLLGVLVAGALVVFYLQWQEAHTLLTVRVVDGSTGNVTVYQVLRKDLDGREFLTVDGRRVSLGAGDRMELAGP